MNVEEIREAILKRFSLSEDDNFAELLEQNSLTQQEINIVRKSDESYSVDENGNVEVSGIGIADNNEEIINLRSKARNLAQLIFLNDTDLDSISLKTGFKPENIKRLLENYQSSNTTLPEEILNQLDDL